MENKLFETGVSGATLVYNDLTVHFLNVSYNFRPRMEFTPLHTHPFYEFYLLLDGRQHTQIRDYEFITRAKEFILVPPGVEHGHQHIPEARDEGIAVRFYLEKRSNAGNCVHIADRMIQALSTTHIRPIYDPEAYRMLTDIPIGMSVEACRLRMIEWLVRMCEVCEQDVFVAPKQSKGIEFIDKHLVERVVLTIETMCSTDISVKDVAATHNISYRHLSRRFQQETGCTMVQAITYLRLRRAMTLLRDTTLPVREIAHRCGFRGEGYFTSVFSKHMQESPTQYRNASAPRRKWEDVLAEFGFSPECQYINLTDPWKA